MYRTLKHKDSSIIEQGIETMDGNSIRLKPARQRSFPMGKHGKTTVHAFHLKALTPGGHWETMSWNHRIPIVEQSGGATQLVPIHAGWRTDNGLKQFPAMHV